MAALDDERAPVKRPPRYRRHLHHRLVCAPWQVRRRRFDTLGLALLVVVLALAAAFLWRAALLAVGR